MPVQKIPVLHWVSILRNFSRIKIETGHYASASKAIRAALRLLEERETKLEAAAPCSDRGRAKRFVRLFLAKCFG